MDFGVEGGVTVSIKSAKNRGKLFDGVRCVVRQELPVGLGAASVKYRCCASVVKEVMSLVLVEKSVLGQQMKCEQS